MTLQDRIENWRRWVLYGTIRYSQAESLEGNYRSPQHWHPEGPKAAAVLKADAELLEAAWRTIRPLESRSVVLWHHIYRLPVWTIQRRVKKLYSHAYTTDQMSDEIVKAECRFALAIEALEGAKKVSVCVEVA